MGAGDGNGGGGGDDDVVDDDAEYFKHSDGWEASRWQVRENENEKAKEGEREKDCVKILSNMREKQWENRNRNEK